MTCGRAGRGWTPAPPRRAPSPAASSSVPAADPRRRRPHRPRVQAVGCPPRHRTGRALAKWGLGGTLALAAFIVGMAAVAVRKAMDRWWITPLHLALQQLSGSTEKTRWPVDKRPRSWIHVTRQWENGKRGVWFRLPPTFNSGNQGLKDAFVATAFDKAELSAADIDYGPNAWKTGGRRGSLTLKPAKRMPDKVLLSAPKTRQAVEAVKDRWGYLVGYTNGWAPVVQSLEDDAPHILIAGPTKTGKSQLVKVILWQLLTKLQDRGQPSIYVLDIKGYSHLDFEGRPGVTYARNVAEINTALLEVIALALDRGDEALAGQAGGPGADVRAGVRGPRGRRRRHAQTPQAGPRGMGRHPFPRPRRLRPRHRSPPTTGRPVPRPRFDPRQLGQPDAHVRPRRQRPEDGRPRRRRTRHRP